MNLFIKKALAATGDAETTEIVNDLLGVLTGGQGNKIFLWAIGIGGLLAFGTIVYAGVLMAISGGGEGKSKAKELIVGAVQGLVLLAVGYLILYVINPNILSY